MKKILVVVAVVAMALVIFGAGVVFAQFQPVAAAGYGPGMMGAWNAQNGTPQPYGPGGMMGGRGGRGGPGGYGVMHNYVETALADKLGLTEAQVETEQAAGKTMAQIATAHGIAAADITAVLTEVHKTAFAKAVTDGVMTQAQADAMLANMTAQGFDFANCPMGGAGPQDGTGYRGGGRGGRGGMMGGNWQQPQPTTAP
jgi:hypothetical protein